MINPLLAVRWAGDQIEDEWIRPAVGCEWFCPEGGRMALDDDGMREALLERALAELAHLRQSDMVLERRLALIDGHLERLVVRIDGLTRVLAEEIAPG